jgi:hypothetical protein
VPCATTYEGEDDIVKREVKRLLAGASTSSLLGVEVDTFVASYSLRQTLKSKLGALRGQIWIVPGPYLNSLINCGVVACCGMKSAK